MVSKDSWNALRVTPKSGRLSIKFTILSFSAIVLNRCKTDVTKFGNVNEVPPNRLIKLSQLASIKSQAKVRPTMFEATALIMLVASCERIAPPSFV